MSELTGHMFVLGKPFRTPLFHEYVCFIDQEDSIPEPTAFQSTIERLLH